MKRFSMNLPEDLHKRLKLWCVEHDKEMTQIIIQLIEEFLGKQKKKK